MGLASSRAGLASARPRLAAAPKRADRDLLDPRWRKLREEVIAERGARCEECGAEGYVELDHIKERRDGGAKYDRANVKLLCRRHHSRKTQSERRRRLGLG